MKLTPVFAVAATCLLSGCILVAQGQATKARTALVGKTKSEILACAGVPGGTYRDGSTEYFAYSGSGMRRGGAVNYVGSGVFLTSGGGQAQCVATIALRNGRVSVVNYRSSGGALTAPDEACGYLVSSCL